MALQKEVISFPLNRAIEGKVDPKALPLPSLLTLENARIDKEGSIRKRYGYVQVGKATVNSQISSTEDADALGTFADELLVFSKKRLFSYSPQADVCADKGTCVSASVTTKEILRGSYTQRQVDVAVYNNIACFFYEDWRAGGSRGVRYTVVDNVSGAVLLDDASIDTDGTFPRVVAFDGSFYLFWASLGTLKGLRINPLNPASYGAVVSISANLNTTYPTFDAITNAGAIVLAYNNQSATRITVVKLSNSISALSSLNINEDGNSAISVIAGTNGKSFVSWHNATGVRSAVVSALLATTAGPVTVEAIASVVQLTGYALPAGGGIKLFYQISAAATYNHYIKANTVYDNGGLETPAVFLRSVGIASKAFTLSGGTEDIGYVGIVHQSSEQSTYFVAKSDGHLVAKFQNGKASGHLVRAMPCGVWERSTNAFQFAVLSTRITSSEDSNFFTTAGISSITVDFSDFRNYSSVELSQNCLIAGGVIQNYDSVSVTEHGFHLYPENVSLAESAGGDLTATGVYSYVVCYEWTDNSGKTHRSAPSSPVSITLTGVNDRVTATIPTLRLTAKQQAYGRAPVSIVLYRTENAGTVYYRASSLSSPTLNSVTSDTTTIVDDLSDSDLISREPLYTNGGILENTTPPSASIIAPFRGRAFLAGTEDDVIWYSKLIDQVTPPQFNDAFTLQVESTGGRITALFPLDDKLIIFKEASVYYTAGDGPEDNGEGQTLLTPEFITSDAGCIDSKSVVTTPLGLMFKSRKGFYLLTRDLNVQYVGASAEDFNSYEVTSATLVADSNEVRFTTNNGPTIVYNYFFNRWSVNPLLKLNDSVAWQQMFVGILSRVGQTAVVVKEMPGTYKDIDATYSLKIGFAWGSFAQIQGFQRVWRSILLGDFRSPHKLKLSISYDFQPYVSDEYIFDPESRFALSDYGDGAYYGADAVYGGSLTNFGTYQIRTHLVQQKCQSVQLTVEDINPEESCESYSLSGVAFEVAKKKGVYKLQAAQTT